MLVFDKSVPVVAVMLFCGRTTTLFCCDVLDLSPFTHFLEDFGQNSVFLGSKTVFLGQEVHYYTVYIALFTESINRFTIVPKSYAFVMKNSKYATKENSVAIFASP